MTGTDITCAVALLQQKKIVLTHRQWQVDGELAHSFKTSQISGYLRQMDAANVKDRLHSTNRGGGLSALKCQGIQGFFCCWINAKNVIISDIVLRHGCSGGNMPLSCRPFSHENLRFFRLFSFPFGFQGVLMGPGVEASWSRSRFKTLLPSQPPSGPEGVPTLPTTCFFYHTLGGACLGRSGPSPRKQQGKKCLGIFDRRCRKPKAPFFGHFLVDNKAGTPRGVRCGQSLQCAAVPTALSHGEST